MQPWDRQPGETTRAWEAFKTYRDMGLTRSLSKTADQLGKTKRLVHRWSAERDWVQRCEAWDAEQDRLFRLEMAEARKDAAERNVKVARASMTAIGQAVADLARNPTKLKPHNVAQLMEAVVKLQQVTFSDTLGPAKQCNSAGDAEADVDLDWLTDEDRRVRMEGLRREINRRLDKDGVRREYGEPALNQPTEEGSPALPGPP